MRAGDLNQRITIHSKTVTGRDSAGGEVLTWSTFATVWAQKVHQSSREFFAAHKSNSEITDMFIIRYRAGVTTEMRVSYNGKYYDIIGADDPDGKRVEIHVLCKVVL